MKKQLFSIIAIAMVVFLAGCAKEPVVELDAAKAAVAKAAAEGADRYAPATYNAAQDTLNAAVAEIEAQKEKFSLFRKYDVALNLLTSATTISEQAVAEAGQMKLQVKEEVVTMLGEVKAMIEQTTALIATAPVGKEGKAALEAMTAENSAMEAAVNDIAAQVEGTNDPLTLKERLMQISDKATALNTELNNVIEKYKSARKGKR
jgi:hypothetical protein